MCYAYVLALAARRKGKLALLDWGGGAGHYYKISKALLPEIQINYRCFDKPALCELGRRLLPEAEFLDNPESALCRSYDLVLASASLQYFEEWSKVVKELASVTDSFLFVTRLPIVQHVPSFVVVQRPYRYGYKTEYLGWFLNRQAFLREIEGTGCGLVREFLIGQMPFVKGAPEQGESRGFLFRFASGSRHANYQKEV
jgi:putative methyltransferase (TIGR04325 family)